MPEKSGLVRVENIVVGCGSRPCDHDGQAIHFGPRMLAPRVPPQAAPSHARCPARSKVGQRTCTICIDATRGQELAAGVTRRVCRGLSRVALRLTRRGEGMQHVTEILLLKLEIKCTARAFKLFSLLL